jgi:glycerophosphoryl diester phosphodiesterase
MVNVWTIDEPAEIRLLTALGVDGIITNRPAATRSMIR